MYIADIFRYVQRISSVFYVKRLVNFPTFPWWSIDHNAIFSFHDNHYASLDNMEGVKFKVKPLKNTSDYYLHFVESEVLSDTVPEYCQNKKIVHHMSLKMNKRKRLSTGKLLQWKLWFWNYTSVQQRKVDKKRCPFYSCFLVTSFLV